MKIRSPFYRPCATSGKRIVCWAEEYIIANEMCEKHAERILSTTRKYAAWCADRPSGETDSQRLSAWLQELSGELAPATVNGKRQTILTLLRFGTEEGEPLPRSDRIRRVREPDKIKPAFTQTEIETLLAKAPEYFPVTVYRFGRGKVTNTRPRTRPDCVPWAVWWSAYIRAAWESGQYLSDLRRIRWDEIGSDNVVTLARHKTGRLLAFRFSAETLEACRTIGHPELILPWPFNLGTYFPKEFRRFCKFAGVRPLGPKSLRRAAITAVYQSQGAEAARILAGHSSFQITSRHYVDWSQARRQIVEPPALR